MQNRNIRYFPIDAFDLQKLAGTESRIFDNDDLSIILNGRPADNTFFSEGEVYHLPEPRLMIFLSGEVDVHLNLEQYHFERGTVLLSTPDMIVEFEHIGRDAMICGIGIKEAIQIAETIVLKASDADFELLLRMLYLLWDVASQSPFRREAVLPIVRAMIADVQYLKQAAGNTAGDTAISRSQELFRQFKTLVSRHCEQERNIPFYAELMRISPHHLSAVISQASGHSAMYWINRATLLRAKLLLRTGDLLTYEIAERLHFANPPAFNAFFKRETGLTPKEYRHNK